MVRTTKTKEYLKQAKANGEEEPELTPKGQKPRTLTPEHLEKLKIARIKAREAQIRNTEARRKKKEEEQLEPPVEQMNKIDLSTNEKILEEPEPDLESDEEPEPVVIKKEKKKKPRKKPVVIVEESDSESDAEGNVVYIKRRSNKKKELPPPPPPEPQPVKEVPQFSYPRNPFYSMPFRML